MSQNDESPVTIALSLANQRIAQDSAIVVEISLRNTSRRRVEVPEFSFDDPSNTWLHVGVGNETTGAHVGQFSALDVLGSKGLNIPRELHVEPGPRPTTTLTGGQIVTLSINLLPLTGPLPPGKYGIGVYYETFDGELSDELEFEVVAK